MVEQSSYSKILDSLATAVVVLDYELRVLHMNVSCESLFGVSKDQVEDKPFASCLHPNETVTHTLQESLEQEIEFTKRKVQWKLHNNQTITVDYTFTPNPESDQVIIEIQPLDRLLRISREEAWIASQETSRNLVRSMAHEIKNPLGGIRGAAQLLSHEFDDPQLEEYTRIIIEETDRLRDLVDRMLGPRTPPVVTPVNIHEVLEHICTVASLEIKDKIPLVRDYDPSIPEIVGDRTQLIQAFLNILRNAIQALSENKHQQNPCIVIATRIQRRYTIGKTTHPLVAKISIKDNGPGIPQNLIDNIFFPMISGRAEGTGLGLSISQNLIGQHSGLIECKSEPGSTEFTVFLPLGN